MPTTRSQTQMVSQRKTRALRKKVKPVVYYEEPLVTFDFMEMDQARLEDVDSEIIEKKTTITEEVVGESSKSGSGSGSSARTRPYIGTAAKVNGENVQVLENQTETPASMEVDENKEIENPKPVAVSSENFQEVFSSSPLEAQAVKPQDTCPSVSDGNMKPAETKEDLFDTLVDGKAGKREAETDSVELNLKQNGAKKIPRYVLTPDAFQDNPTERERILKSIYDRKRREKEMKQRVGKLKQENIHLKKMLLFAMMGKPPTNGRVIVAVNKPGTALPAPSPAFLKKMLAERVLPKPSGKTATNAAIPLPRPIPNLPTLFPLPMKQGHQTNPMDVQLKSVKCKTAKPRQPRLSVPAEVNDVLAKEKECINKLYQQLENDDEDMSSILASIPGSMSMSSAKGNEVSTKTAGEIKRKQGITSHKEKQRRLDDDDDEVQVLKEVGKLNKPSYNALSQRYADVIFEEA